MPRDKPQLTTKQDDKSCASSGHGWMHMACLAACIGVPVAFAAYYFLGNPAGEWNLSLSSLFPILLCLGMHFVIMRMMHRSDDY